ncbi:MAG: ATP-dependent helicase [Thermodesulfobacteria bacterium]|nr:ATP-dependent helicase [Thermodesulfobacteriota bacterium]
MDWKEPLKELNARQREAVVTQDSHLVVVAGPGTGKTRVLTARILHLLDKGVEPGRLLAITFTNKAAAQISDRLADAGLKDLPFVGTFHSWAYSLISQVHGKRPYVIDEGEQLELLKEAWAKAGLEGESKSVFKRFLLLRQMPEVPLDQEEAALRELWSQYKALLEGYEVVDFDELLHEATSIIKDSPDVLPSHLLVDEFQDVNPIQYEMVKGVGKTAWVSVIGDPKQAIYGFRGASPAYIEEFQKEFSPLKKVTLEAAYRCPQRFLDAASALFPKSPPLKSQKEAEGEIQHKIFSSEEKEAAWIAKEIDKMAGGLSFESFNYGNSGEFGERSLADICILFRARVVSRAVLEALVRQGIPFHVPLSQRGESSKLLSMLNHLGGMLLGRSKHYHLSRLGLDEHGVNELLSCLERFRKGEEGHDAFLTLFERVYGKKMSQDDEEAILRFLDSVSQGLPPSILYSNEQDEVDFETEAVTLMTLHASKGLEFPVVFLVGVDKDIIPWKDSDIEEERRLLYVGLTRSSQQLYITCSRKRSFYGQVHRLEPSPFLKGLEPYLSVERVRKPVKKKSMKKKQKSLF